MTYHQQSEPSYQTQEGANRDEALCARARWLNYPSEGWFYWIPSRAGEADLALDRNTNTIFIPITVGVDLAVKAGPFGTLGVIPGIAQRINQGKNVTLYALDAVTGKVRWRSCVSTC